MISAFVLGLFGSAHCIGMCGPLMLALSGLNQSKTTFWIYNAGRILAYMLIGMILGVIGRSFQLLEIQKGVTIVIGIVLILIYTFPKSKRILENWYFQSALYHRNKTLLSRVLSVRRRWFLGGIANGFLPCGLTYVAAAGALTSGGFWSGLLFMAIFGIGTLPGLRVFTIGSSWFAMSSKKIKFSPVPILGIISGGILLFRGLIMSFPDFHQIILEHRDQVITLCGL